MFPESSVSTIVRAVNEIRANATVLGLIGLGLLVWSSLGLFGALESAFNIVYGRPNRSFFRGKALAAGLMIGLLVVLFAGLVVGSFGQNQLSHHAPGVAGNSIAAFILSLAASSAASFAFLFVSYYVLTNVPHTPRDVFPGAIASTLALALTFQVLPLYLDLAQGSPALQAFGGPLILLVWLYLMANVIVLGAELNWWFGDGGASGALVRRRPSRGSSLEGLSRREQRRAPRGRPMRVPSAFHASPSSATVRCSPSGTNTGSKPKPSSAAGLERDRAPRASPVPRNSRPPERARRARRRSAPIGQPRRRGPSRARPTC